MTNVPREGALESRIVEAMGADRHRLRQRLRAIRETQRAGRDVEAQLKRWEQDLARSAALLEQRRRNVPPVTYDDALPVAARREEIAAAIRDHQVVIVCGETGSGKSTQLPKICLELGRGVERMIGQTQPRRIAARSIAGRIAQELLVPLGGPVGFKMRFTDGTGPETCIKVMTDGILLAETQNDRFLDQYDAIIVDEAHERSLNIDFLLGYLKRLLPKRPDLKVVITSATLDAERFAEHFAAGSAIEQVSTREPPLPPLRKGGTKNDATASPVAAPMRVPVLQVSGRMFPVEVLYRPLAAEDDEREPDLVRNVVAAVVELAQKPPTPPSPTSGGGSLGDVLIFMATEHDIHETAKALRSRTLPGDYPGRETLVLPLYARLPAAQQQLVFQPHSHRKIVIATNVAESSLTVPGIRYVIDPGTARISRYAARSKVQRLPVEAISQASADQRKGRCGRVGPGVCVRLYSEEDYLSRERFTPPEIQRTNLAAVILQTKALGLGEIEEFPFLDPPRPGAVRDGYQTLFEIGALGAERDLTELGRKLARIPADPRIARMIVAAHDEGCLAEVLIIASALEIQDPRERPAEKRQAAQESHAQFLHPESDFLAHLKLWDFYHHLKETLSRSALARACRQNFLSLARLWEWSDIHRQLLQVAAEAGMKPTAASQSPRREDYGAIHRALLTGLLSNVAHLGEGREYTVAGGVKMHLWPGSGLFAKTPKWVMAAELVETSRRYLRTVAKIDVEWIEPLALHLVNRSYSEPQWDRKGGSAIAFEKVSLFGLPIVPRRRVRLGKIDPATAQELMIRDGLVPGEIDTRAEFLQHNLKLAEEAEKLRAKARRNDLLRDEEARFEFYDARLPADVYDAPSLETWRKEAERKEPKRLFMRLEDLLRDEARDVRAEDFPDAIAVDQMKLALEYRLEPGAEGDGITLTVPKEAVGQIDPRRLGWLVPGLLEQKIAALIKTLPKDLRRLCVPVPETAKRVVGELRFGHGSMETQAAAALCKLTGQEVRAEMFEADKLPPHLRMNVRVVDAEGATVAASRDLAELREKVGPSAAPIEIVDDPRFMRDGIKRWDFGDLPEHVTVARGGITLKAFPALVDAGDAVSLRLFDSPELAARQMRSGLRRLFYLAEGKSLRPGLPNAEALLLRASTFIKPDEFRRQAAQRIAERAFLAEGELPRTEADFLALQKFGRSRIAAATQEVAGVLAALVEAQHLARVALESLPKGPLAHAAQDVKVQLAALLPPRFLVEAPWQWLKEFPRYLRAIQSRLEKLPRNVDRDRRHTEEVARLWDEYAKRAAESERLSIVDEELVAYRYLLEEYRVSLFAQELGTAVPVSPKRLAKQWEKVGLAKGRAG